MHIGTQIKKARRAAGLTQEELAGLINKTRPLISHIENTGKVNSHTLSALSNVLDLTPTEAEEKPVRYQNDNKTTTKDHYQIEKLISALVDEIATLKELVASQKEVISLLRQKSNS